MPHSEIPGSTIARISPGLIAACYVLHRLSVPRHPPDALLFALEHRTQRQIPEPYCYGRLTADAATSLFVKTHVGHAPAACVQPYGQRQVCRTCPPRSRHILAYSPFQSTKRNGSVITSASRKGTSYRVASDTYHPSCHRNGGGERDRTDDLLLAKQALSQLSYTPRFGRHLRHLDGGPGRI